MRVGWSRIIVSLCAVVFMFGYGSIAHAEENVRLALEWLISGRHVGFFVALDKGYYKAEGLNVTIDRGYGSGDTVKRVATGSADFGIADITTLLSARANSGAPAVMVATFFNNDPEAVLVLKSSGIAKLQDLDGKRIGGGSTSASLKLLPALATLTGLKNYHAVPMSSDQIYPALLSKQVSGITGFTDNAAFMAPQAKKMGDSIMTFAYSDYGIQDYGSAIITQEKMVDAKSPVIAKFLSASLKGVAWAIKHPDESVAILRKYAPLVDTDVALQTWEIDRKLIDTPETQKYGLGSLRADRVKVTYDMAQKYLGLERKIDVDKAFDVGFLPKTPILP